MSMVQATMEWTTTPPRIERVRSATVPRTTPATMAPRHSRRGCQVDHGVRHGHHEHGERAEMAGPARSSGTRGRRTRASGTERRTPPSHKKNCSSDSPAPPYFGYVFKNDCVPGGKVGEGQDHAQPCPDRAARSSVPTRNARRSP
jgi:hypothetical protein